MQHDRNDFSPTHTHTKKSAKHKAKKFIVSTLTHSSYVRLLSTAQEKHRLQQHFLISSQFMDEECGLEYTVGCYSILDLVHFPLQSWNPSPPTSHFTMTWRRCGLSASTVLSMRINLYRQYCAASVEV